MKGKKRCYFCRRDLNNQNRTQVWPSKPTNGRWMWVDCCHSCKAKEERKG
jgi:hypothetical protein